MVVGASAPTSAQGRRGALGFLAVVSSAVAQLQTVGISHAVVAEGGGVAVFGIATGLGRQRHRADAAGFFAPPAVAGCVTQPLVHLVATAGAGIFECLALTGRAETHDSLQRSRQKRRDG